MEGDHGIGKVEPRGGAARRLVADDEPCCTWETIVENVCYNADVNVYVRSSNEAGVDVRHPELTECSVDSWKKEGAKIEDERAIISAIGYISVQVFRPKVSYDSRSRRLDHQISHSKGV